MARILTFIKNHKILTAIIAIAVAGTGFSLLRPEPPPQRDVITASKQTISQEVEITGRVEPAEKIELAVETGGRVRTINHKVGDRIAAGDVLLQVDSGELSVRLAKQQASLTKAKLALAKLEKPAGSLANIRAENDLSAAVSANENAENDLQEAYESGFNSVTDAFLDIPSSISTLEDLMDQQYLARHFIRSIYGEAAEDYQVQADTLLSKADNAYEDVERTYRTLTRDSDPQQLEQLIKDSYEVIKLLSDAAKSVNNLLDYIERRVDNPPSRLAVDQATIDTVTGEVNVHTVALLEARSLVQTSQDAVTNSAREVDEARAAVLDLFEGAESEDVQSARLTVQEAELDIQETELLLADRMIRSPISGIVTDVSADVGEVIAAGNPVISVISTNSYQVSASLPEADIFKIEPGSPATITLDAYGNDRMFKAVVSSINPAETLLEGVATYEMTLQFEDGDSGIRSGMTADIAVQGDKKDNVIAVPQRAVITKSDGKFIRVLENSQEVEKRVTTGMRGSDGNVEITSGLNEGEQVIVFSEAD